MEKEIKAKSKSKVWLTGLKSVSKYLNIYISMYMCMCVYIWNDLWMMVMIYMWTTYELLCMRSMWYMSLYDEMVKNYVWHMSLYVCKCWLCYMIKVTWSLWLWRSDEWCMLIDNLMSYSWVHDYVPNVFRHVKGHV